MLTFDPLGTGHTYIADLLSFFEANFGLNTHSFGRIAAGEDEFLSWKNFMEALKLELELNQRVPINKLEKSAFLTN